jgi:hypothetical protein
MKKYLMSGIAALAFCAAFTSCSNKEDLYDQGQINQNEAEKVKANYDAAFIATFGQPAANQDWGFGTRANTRATGEFADYHGAYADANMWTYKGFKAPDPLTDGQKLRVQYYFQMTKITNPNQPNNLSQDFFMQQVYDGGDDPMSPTYKTGYSTEQYYDGAGNEIVSGQHMDHLTAGTNHLHIYNFNNSTCGTYPNVANWNQTDVNDVTQQHEDQIELMLNTDTSCFGYANSNNTEIYDDQWTLVAGSVIDNFCDVVDPAGYAAFLAAHSGVTDKAVVDTWNRSFIGFDFKLSPNPSPVMSKTVKYSDAGMTSEIFNQTTQTNEKFYYNGTDFVAYTNENVEILINNNAIHYVENDMNFYGANVIGVGGQDGHDDFPTEAAFDSDPNATNDGSLYLKNVPGKQDDKRILNLKFIERMVTNGYYPVDTKQLRLWAKVNDQKDGYYTDWIVSFMPASYNPPVWDIRIIGEDLNAQANDGDTEDSDWDFNDVVFDVKFLSANEAKISLVAAGGTLPLIVGYTGTPQDNTDYDDFEVHKLFGVDTDYMVNTHAEDEGLKGGAPAAGHEVPSFNVTIQGVQAANGKNIPIYVQKTLSDGTKKWFELTAEVGQPAAKIGVAYNFPVIRERKDINSLYPNFMTWVRTTSPARWWDSNAGN